MSKVRIKLEIKAVDDKTDAASNFVEDVIGNKGVGVMIADSALMAKLDKTEDGKIRVEISTFKGDDGDDDLSEHEVVAIWLTMAQQIITAKNTSPKAKALAAGVFEAAKQAQLEKDPVEVH